MHQEIPPWATESEGNNILYNKAVGAGAIPGSILFKSSAEIYLEGLTLRG